jgi:2'-5' RNA ligase
MVNYLKINIAFRAPKEVESEIIKLSQEIGEKNDSYFILDGINFYPHITIYSSVFSEPNLSKVLEVVGGFVKKVNNISFKYGGAGSGQGFISLNFDCFNEIKEIHKDLVAALNLLREPLTEEDLSDYNMVFSEKQRENILNYGYPDAMDSYVPHMTIIRLKDEQVANNIAKEIKWRIDDFKVDGIACYLMGNNGTCKQLIREFS